MATRTSIRRLKNNKGSKKSLNISLPILAKMKALFLADPYLLPFDKLMTQIRQMSPTQQHYLLGLCKKALNKIELRRIKFIRVAIAKTIVALVPETTDIIKYWINKKSGRYIYEVHFSLFCFLDWVPELPNAKNFTNEIPLLLQDYLLQVNTEAAYAAWMVGDLLGDHWNLSQSLPALMKCAREAKFVPGRKGAIHGLAHALAKLLEDNPSVHNSTIEAINTLLQDISISDRSKKIREEAIWVLEGKYS